ncbi:hypothetical protein [Novosphingobium sp.]|uniref:hypothetical protein n=1 Tax=Novosphingobium sp. TaxID=1874826 RepID=UPI003D12F4FE
MYAPARFYVQEPDGRKDWSEEKRQEAFFATLHRAAPKVAAHHIKNEGNYNHAKAKRGGVVSGVFDIRVDGAHPLSAAIELKGYSKAGRPGVLSQAQIDWGNSMIDRGWHVACFFDPVAAINWLRDIGFPVSAVRAA